MEIDRVLGKKSYMISFVLKPLLTFLDATFGARLMVGKDAAIATLLSSRHIHIPVLEGTGNASGAGFLLLLRRGVLGCTPAAVTLDIAQFSSPTGKPLSGAEWPWDKESLLLVAYF